MLKIYVAGPFRAPSRLLIEQNVLRAKQLAETLWKRGAAVLCPHANTIGMDGPDEIYLQGGIELMKMCDVVVVLPGWERSEGTKRELEEAANHYMTVYMWPRDREALEGIIEDEKKPLEDA